MSDARYEIGIIGLGTMGQNLLLNMADHGYAVAGFNRDESKVRALNQRAGDRPIMATSKIEALVAGLRRPRAIMMLVPAGDPVDSVIASLRPHLEEDDLLIDGGNSHFRDTNRRVAELAEDGLHFIGMGVSGGAEGARHGPSLMPGGPEVAYERVRELFEDVAAHVNGEPCITYLGQRSAGHYVKMVHNGIEYGLMQLLAESYDLMHRGLRLTNAELHNVYAAWNAAELNSFLVEITARIFEQEDERGDGLLIDKILDTAKQKGTGKWTSQDALDLGIPTPNIDVAVTMRYLSALKGQRVRASEMLSRPRYGNVGDRGMAIGQLRNAIFASMVITFAQGFSLLQAASTEYDYGLDLEATARIWRGGCIIRASLLEEFRRAYKGKADLDNLLLDPQLGAAVLAREPDLRASIDRALGLGIPVPGLSVALSYLDAYRSERLPANLIQAQRDLFGSHTYQRTDAEGSFHTEWD